MKLKLIDKAPKCPKCKVALHQSGTGHYCSNEKCPSCNREAWEALYPSPDGIHVGMGGHYVYCCPKCFNSYIENNTLALKEATKKRLIEITKEAVK